MRALRDFMKPAMAAIALLMAASQAFAEAKIQQIYPQTVLPGTLFVVMGEGFGDTPGAVEIGDARIEQPLSWSDTAVWFRIPEGVKNGAKVKMAQAESAQAVTLAPEGSVTVRWQVDAAQAQAVANRDYTDYGLNAAPKLLLPLALKGQWVKSGDTFGNFESGWDGGSKVVMFDDPNSNFWFSECVFTPDNLKSFGESLLMFGFEDANTTDRNLSPFESDAAVTIKTSWAKHDAYPDVDTDPAVKMSKDNPAYDAAANAIVVASPLQADLSTAKVSGLYPQTVLPGTLLAITGEGFGAIQGEVKIGDAPVNALDWQENVIWVRVPENTPDGAAVTVGKAAAPQTLTLAPQGSIRVVWRVDVAQAQALANDQFDEHGLNAAPQFVVPLYLKGQWVKSGDKFGDFESGWDGGSKVVMYQEPGTELRLSECVFTPQDIATFGGKPMYFAFEDGNSTDRNLSPFESDAALILKAGWAKADAYKEVDTDAAALISDANPAFDKATATILLETPFHFDAAVAPKPVEQTESPAKARAIDEKQEAARIVPASDFFNAWDTLGNVASYQREGNALTLNLDQEKVVKLAFLTPSMFRVRFNKAGDYAQDFSYAVIKSDFGSVEMTVAETDAALIVNTADLTVNVQKSPFRLAVFKGDALIHGDADGGIAWQNDRIMVHKQLLPGAKFYGFGEKAGSLLKNGASMTMWNSDVYGYGKNSNPLYLSIPFFLEINQGYAAGILFDNTHQSYFDMGAKNANAYYFGALNGEMNYYFIAGGDSKAVIRQYTELTGRLNMPPKWALGYQQCRYSYYPAARVEEIAKNFRERKLPCDVIYLDIDFMNGNKSFTVDESRFPDAANFLKKLKAQGFKFITILDPGIKVEKGYHVYDSGLAGDHFLKMPDGSMAKGTVWPGLCVFPDFTKADTRAWWGKLYQSLLDLGLDGFWNDMNEPAIFNTPHKTMWLDAVHDDFGQKSPHAKIHNVYGMQMIRATLEGLNALRPQVRNFVLSRSGYAGLQRYGALWTGDNTANWEHLRLNIPMVLNLGLSGMPITGADIGGYSGAPSAELFARWMQLGALIPLYRGHTEKGTPDQEPWAFGKEVEDISRTYLELRYTMLQHLYDLAYEASQTGVPIARPLFMEFPQDEQTYAIEDEYMVGDDLLVAPVVEEGEVKRSVYLPGGTQWFDYWTGKSFEGGKSYDVDAPLDVMPLFVKAGSLIPTQEVVQYVGEKPVNPVTLLVYPGQNDAYALYLDDEMSNAYQTGQFREIAITHSASDKAQTVAFDVVKDGAKPTATGEATFVKFLLAEKPASVVINDKTVDVAATCETLAAANENAACFDAEKRVVAVKFVEVTDDAAVTVAY